MSLGRKVLSRIQHPLSARQIVTWPKRHLLAGRNVSSARREAGSRWRLHFKAGDNQTPCRISRRCHSRAAVGSHGRETATNLRSRRSGSFLLLQVPQKSVAPIRFTRLPRESVWFDVTEFVLAVVLAGAAFAEITIMLACSIR
jgi:hypothetical protein